MLKPLHTSFITLQEPSSSARGFKPQFFACLHSHQQAIGNTRIELYRTEEQAKSQQAAQRCIVIKPHITIGVKKERHSFTIGNTTILTQSDADLKQWLTRIYQAQPTVKGLSDYSSQIYDEISDPKNDRGPFMVTLQQCDNLSFYGPCQLEIQPNIADKIYSVAVYDMNQPPRLVIRWQIDHLRGYGSNESVLKIQTGRRTPTGVGTFIFQTSDGPRVHQAIHCWAEVITSNPTPATSTSPVVMSPPRAIPQGKPPPKPSSQANPIVLPPRDPRKPSKVNGSSSINTDPVMEQSSAYEPLRNQRAEKPSLYEPMRKPTSTDTTASVPTPGVGDVYQPLNIADSKDSIPYQSLVSNSREQKPSVYEDVNSKVVKMPITDSSSYASLGIRDQKQESYMSVNHATS